MTAAILTRTAYPETSARDELLDAVSRAREGDYNALGYVFDTLFYDVYHEVVLSTRDRQRAEHVTREALSRLPRLLSSGRFASIDDLRAALLRDATQSITPRHEAHTAASGLQGLRAGVRHLVLLTASVAAAAALLLAL